MYMRLLVESALRNQAVYVALAHNHPTGDLTASEDDIAVTYKVAEAMEPINIRVLDHIIVGGGRLPPAWRQHGVVRHANFGNPFVASEIPDMANNVRFGFLEPEREPKRALSEAEEGAADSDER